MVVSSDAHPATPAERNRALRHKVLDDCCRKETMNRGRRSFILGAITGTVGFMAGCAGAGRSGEESTIRDTTNRNDQSSSETATTIATSRSESSTAPSAARDTRSTTDTVIVSRSPSETDAKCREAPTRRGTAVIEAAPPDISIENDTDMRQTVRITATRLPAETTPRPPDEAPHEPLDLAGRPTVFERTIELPADGVRVYRCTGIDVNGYSGAYQVKIAVRDGPVGAFDWGRNTASLDIDITMSSVEFSVRQGR